MNETIEPRRIRKMNFIYGSNQANSSIPSTDNLYSVDKHGNFVEKKLPEGKTIQSVYWAKKRKTIAVMGGLSSFALFSIMLQETAILDGLFAVIAEGFGFVIGLLWSLI